MPQLQHGPHWVPARVERSKGVQREEASNNFCGSCSSPVLADIPGNANDFGGINPDEMGAAKMVLARVQGGCGCCWRIALAHPVLSLSWSCSKGRRLLSGGLQSGENLEETAPSMSEWVLP